MITVRVRHDAKDEQALSTLQWRTYDTMTQIPVGRRIRRSTFKQEYGDEPPARRLGICVCPASSFVH